MKSVLLISFSEASSPKSKEVNYRTVRKVRKKNANPKTGGFSLKKKKKKKEPGSVRLLEMSV